MDITTVDCMGSVCPVPVIETKKALATIDEGTLEIFVDNQTSVDNVIRFAESRHYENSSEKLGDAKWKLTIIKKGTPVVAAPQTASAQGPTVVVVASNKMGDDPELGAILIKGFIYALTQQDELPDTVIFYNSGVKLAVNGAETLPDILTLAQAGVEIMACGTCLKFYDLEPELGVGVVSNMYSIVETQLNAGLIVRP